MKNHPSGFEKWQKELHFHQMKIENRTLISGQMYKYKNETSDKEDHGMLKSFIDDYAVSTPKYLIKAFRIKKVL